MKTNQPAVQHNGLVQAPSGIWLPQQPSSKQQVLNGKQSANNQYSWTEKVFAGKILWDWMSLLLVPLLVGIGTIMVTWQQTNAQNAQHASDQSIAQQARYDDLLKNYEDGIDTLLLTNSLSTAPSESNVRNITHSRTLDVLRRVDASRKGAAIAYIADLGLVQGEYFDKGGVHKKEPIISLSGADLRFADLRFADLYGANLSGVDLNEINLRNADLRNANLKINDQMSFSNDDPNPIKIIISVDSNGHLISTANLHRADLSGADLSGADLSGAKNTTPSQLAAAASLSDTIMPDGTKHP